jgi:drug/metabolite transporter (DMT)-like permease
LAGTALLSFDGTSYEFNIGDVWSIAAAAASAMFILRLEFATKAVSNSSKLNSYSLWIVSFAALVWCLGDEMLSNIHIMNSMTTDTNTDTAIGAVGGSMNVLDVLLSTIESTWNKVVETLSLHPLEVIYLGGVTTALANYIQTKAQRGISAERASIIYALDPVYGKYIPHASTYIYIYVFLFLIDFTNRQNK